MLKESKMDLQFYKIQVKHRDIRRILKCLAEEKPEDRQQYIDMIPDGLTKDTVEEICSSTEDIQDYIDEMDNQRIDAIERMYAEFGC